MFREPRALVEGGRMAVVAPAGPIADEAKFHAGIERLRSRFDVTYDASIFSRLGYLAGDDQRRAWELIAALEDPAVDAIVAARGGYGAMRILEAVGVERVKDAGKLLVGFSDITALHALWACAGLQSVHAPMVEALADLDDPSWQQWVAVVEGRSGLHIDGLASWSDAGSATGPLLGGNLATLHALLGTSYALPLNGAILLIEDVSEAPYRIDRMLTSMRLCGVFDRLAGVVVGTFTDSEPGLHLTTAEQALQEHLSRLPIPVLAGLSTGHTPNNLPIRLGINVTLDTTAATLAQTTALNDCNSS